MRPRGVVDRRLHVTHNALYVVDQLFVTAQVVRRHGAVDGLAKVAIVLRRHVRCNHFAVAGAERVQRARSAALPFPD
jgi:hypothetical protein